MKTLFFMLCFLLIFVLPSEVYAQVGDSVRNNRTSSLIYGQKFYKNDFYKTMNCQNNISLNGKPKFIGVTQAGAIPFDKGGGEVF